MLSSDDPHSVHISQGKHSITELIRTRYTQGTLIITDEYIRVEFGGPFANQETLHRSSLTRVDSQVGAPSVGLGGGVNLTFHGTGVELLHANLVKPKVAQVIIGLLQHPQK